MSDTDVGLCPHCGSRSVIRNATTEWWHCSLCGRAQAHKPDDVAPIKPATDPDVLESVWQGSFKVFGVDVKCHVLNDGQRIIEAKSIKMLIEAMARGDKALGDLDTFARWMRGRGR